MKQTPILFSTPMVQAISNGSKTQTRRLNGLAKVNEHPDNYKLFNTWDETYRNGIKPIPCYCVQFAPLDDFDFGNSDNKIFVECPLGAPGDILWVRETHHITPTGQYLFKADVPTTSYKNLLWKPSIFLTKIQARIWLQIVSIKVERLNDISSIDAEAEGIQKDKSFSGKPAYYNYITNEYIFKYPENSFMTLWCKINGTISWQHNPWVWVIEFGNYITIQPK